jgi:hypothetical protein
VEVSVDVLCESDDADTSWRETLFSVSAMDGSRDRWWTSFGARAIRLGIKKMGSVLRRALRELKIYCHIADTE